MGGTEFRTRCQYGNYMFGGVGGSDSPVAGFGQILVQKSPPSGAWTLEVQLPSEIVAVCSMTTVNFPHVTGSPGKLVAGCRNSNGYATVYARNDATETWQPTYIWNDPSNTSVVEIRAMIAYTDPTGGPGGTPIDYLFAISATTDSTSGNGGIYRATYNASAPGQLVWDATPELSLSNTNTAAQYTAAWNGSGFGVTPPPAFTICSMSMAVLGDGNLYAAVGCQIWKRTNGASPSWNLAWTILSTCNSKKRGAWGRSRKCAARTGWQGIRRLDLAVLRGLLQTVIGNGLITPSSLAFRDVHRRTPATEPRSNVLPLKTRRRADNA
jgi:hypothetical protein